MKPRKVSLLWTTLLAGVVVGSGLFQPATASEKTAARLAEGSLTLEDEEAVLEVLIREIVRNARPPCKNHGSREVYCLYLGDGEAPSDALLKRLSDISPPVRAAAACARDGIFRSPFSAVEPRIFVEWLKVSSATTVHARVGAFCDVAEPVVRRRATGWHTHLGGWVGCGPVPANCIPY